MPRHQDILDSEGLTVLSELSEVSGDSYKSLSTNIRAHIGFLWATDDSNIPNIVSSVRKLDPRVQADDVVQYINQHKLTTEWIGERERLTTEKLNRWYADQQRLATGLDCVFDGHLSKLEATSELQLDLLSKEAARLAKDNYYDRQLTKSLKELTGVFTELYNAKRLARGMETKKENISVSVSSPNLEAALSKIDDILNAKTIDAIPMKPV